MKLKLLHTFANAWKKMSATVKAAWIGLLAVVIAGIFALIPYICGEPTPRDIITITVLDRATQIALPKVRLEEKSTNRVYGISNDSGRIYLSVESLSDTKEMQVIADRYNSQVIVLSPESTKSIFVSLDRLTTDPPDTIGPPWIAR